MFIHIDATSKAGQTTRIWNMIDSVCSWVFSGISASQTAMIGIVAEWIFWYLCILGQLFLSKRSYLVESIISDLL